MRSVLGPGCYVHFDRDLCTGCTDCVRACPTRAIRVQNSKSALIVDQCIGCGECLRVCPTGALTAATSELEEVAQDQISVAIVSPVLYAQVAEVMPQDVLRGLRRMGFQHTMDLSYQIELFQAATREFIERNRTAPQAPWPLISPVCPVVLRLIDVQFPSLRPHVLPFLRPTALLARDVKPRLIQEYGVEEAAVVLYHITPNRSSLPGERSYVDKVLGINDVYSELMRHLQPSPTPPPIPLAHDPPEQDRFKYGTTSKGVLWGMSGGEIAGLDTDRSLAISGLSETIAYLQKIELGLFRDIEYIEFRTCPAGCVGGKHAAVDKYLAQSALQKLARMLGAGQNVTRDQIINLYNAGWFVAAPDDTEPVYRSGMHREPLTIASLQEIDTLLEKIQGKDCALCGAPNCRTFAEDVVRSRASLRDCFLMCKRERSGPK
ncbi:MAG: 4Fe-4S binding protein [Desulfobacterales bacterium]|nr:MAG: 4Fe-4S binding protein [Desulfobacterales bacterium]